MKRTLLFAVALLVVVLILLFIRFTRQHSDNILLVAFESDDRLLVLFADGKLFEYTVTDERLANVGAIEARGATNAYYSRGNKQLLYCNVIDQGPACVSRIRSFDLARKEDRAVLEVDEPIRALRCSEDGRFIAGGGFDAHGYVWEVTRGDELTLRYRTEFRHSGCFAFSPDGKYFAVATGRVLNLNEVEVVGTNDWKKVSTLKWTSNEDFIRSLCFLDNEHILMGGRGRVSLFAIDGRCIWEIPVNAQAGVTFVQPVKSIKYQFVAFEQEYLRPGSKQGAALISGKEPVVDRVECLGRSVVIVSPGGTAIGILDESGVRLVDADNLQVKRLPIGR